MARVRLEAEQHSLRALTEASNVAHAPEQPAADPQRRVRAILRFTGACLVAYAATLAALGTWFAQGADSETVRYWLVATSMFAGVAFLSGFGVVWRIHAKFGASPSMVTIFAAGLLMRLIVLTSPAFLEDDYHRYLWDGAVAAHGLNPYACAPAAVLAGDVPGGAAGETLAQLAATGRDTLTQVNHPDLRTIYGPAAELAFAIAYWIQPWSMFAWRGVLLIFDVAAVALIIVALRRMQAPAWWCAWYWWNPLLFREIISSGHMDALLFPLIVAAMLLATRARYLSGAALLALATAVKVWPVVLLPLLLRPLFGDWRRLLAALAAFAGVSAAFWWPVLLTPADDTSGFVAYAQTWRNNEAIFRSIIWIYEQIAGASAEEPFRAHAWARVTVGVLMVILMVVVVRRPATTDRAWFGGALALTAGVFLLSPSQFPWYATWMLPLLAIRPRPSLLLYTALLPLYYLHYEHVWVVWVEHLPVFALLIAESLRSVHRDAEVVADSAASDQPQP